MKLEKIHLSIGVFPKSSSAWKAGLPRETWFISQTPWPVAGCNGPHKHLLMMCACIRACCHTIVRLGLLPLQMPICKRNQKGADLRGCASACAHKRGPEDSRVERNVCVSLLRYSGEVLLAGLCDCACLPVPARVARAFEASTNACCPSCARLHQGPPREAQTKMP